LGLSQETGRLTSQSRTRQLTSPALGVQMSTARPTALIRRAVALPIGLLGRIEASLDAHLDAGFTRIDGALDRRIADLVDRSNSISQGLIRSADSLDRALEHRIIKSDSLRETRVAKSLATADALVLLALRIEDRANVKLNRSLHRFDRLAAIVPQAAFATFDASVALTHRSENKIARGFDRVDARATNVINRAHVRRTKVLNLAHRITAGIDHRIEANLLSIDARVDVRIAQGTNAVATTINSVNARALTFEKAIDHEIARVDTKIASGVARGVAAQATMTHRINIIDNELSSSLTGIDYRFDKRVAKATYGYVKISEFATNRIAISDAKLDGSVASFDLRVARGVKTLVTATDGISNFVTDHIEDADSALTGNMSRIDSRVDSLIDLINGQQGRHASQPRTSLPWAATGLTIVLGTLGAATGASVVNASANPPQIDTTVQYDATAAKEAVTQYLNVRDSFQALQASRSRTIQTLEDQIADAQERASQTFVDGNQVIDIANNFSGVPYVRGGTTPSGFDCSGYTSYVFAQMGINLPRVASAQYNWSDKISADDRKPGDLMFWSGRGGVYHVGIYAGGGKMWDAPRPGRRVAKISIWGNPVYGRVPIEAVNAPALRELKAKTAELEKLKANPPQLPITIDENLLPPSD
jgi:cell wall-associated NlpC family hydrolase